jgi:hypothetical protein
MSVNRAQYLQGNSNQGKVLEGQPQGVKDGLGVIISADGSISFDPITSTGVVLLNNTSAFNSYVWPSVQGVEYDYLGILSSGNPGWVEPKGLVNLGAEPSDPSPGEQWFDYSTELTYVYQNKGGSSSWQPEFQGLDPLATNCSATPAFVSGSGTDTSPYIMDTVVSVKGKVILLPSVVTITGLSPYQYVAIKDLNSSPNGNRFQVTSSFTDGEGTLSFKIKFTDSPKSVSGSSYTAQISVGFDSLVRINASISIADDVSILSPGYITGTAKVGETLSYVQGVATGGISPYSYSWAWRLEASDTVLQTNGSNYTLSSETEGGRVYVQLTATDSNLFRVSGNTPKFPSPPAIIERGDFPNTDIGFPATIPGVVATSWLDINSTLRANGCIEFATDGLTFSQGPTSILNGGTISTRWRNTGSCSGAENGVTISGCIYSDLYIKCESLVVDRVPSPFSFTPLTGVVPSSVVTSQSIVPVGYNSTAYVTYNGASTSTNIQASTDNGLTWTNLPLVGGTSVPLNPGGTLRVRMTTGPVLGASYSASINIGSGASVQTASFVATNSSVTTFSTPISFPTTTLQEALSSAWLVGDGPTSLSATGCLQFKVGSGGTWTGVGDPAVPITTGNILYTRWSNTTPSVCGNAPHGNVITGSITNVPSGGTKTNSSSLTIDRVPSPFAFTDLTGQALSSVISSDIINISGINAPTYITLGSPSTLTSIQASVNGAPWVNVPSSGETLSLPPVVSGAGSALQIRGTTGSVAGTTYNATLNIGQSTSINSDTWNVATLSIVPSIATPSITSPTNGATNINPNSVSPPGVTISSSVYSPLNGAGSHVSSDWEIYTSTGSPYVVQVSGDTVNLQSYFLPISSLAVNTTYFVRVRYRTNTPTAVVSEWSNASQFTTVSSFNLQFVLRLNPGLSGTGGLAGAVSGTSAVLVGTNNLAFRTNDGITFTQASLPLTPFSGIAWGLDRYVAVGAPTGSSSNLALSPSDGFLWTTSSLPIPGIISIAYSPSLDLFCMVGLSGRVYTAPPSTLSWTQRTSGTTQDLQSVIWDGSSFRACGGTAYLSSANGVTWALTTIALAPDSTGLGQIAYNPSSGRYFMTRGYTYDSLTDGSTYGLYSTNGTTWTQTIAPGKLETVAAGGNWFVAGSSNSPSSVQIYTSNDAITWTLSYTNNSYYHVHGICYMPQVNRFIFSAHNWVLFSSV